jgi:hypothetical protein
MMAYLSVSDSWSLSTVLTDEQFRTTKGIEIYPEYERKILENSPYLEIETTEE